VCPAHSRLAPDPPHSPEARRLAEFGDMDFAAGGFGRAAESYAAAHRRALGRGPELLTNAALALLRNGRTPGARREGLRGVEGGRLTKPGWVGGWRQDFPHPMGLKAVRKGGVLAPSSVTHGVGTPMEPQPKNQGIRGRPHPPMAVDSVTTIAGYGRPCCPSVGLLLRVTFLSGGRGRSVVPVRHHRGRVPPRVPRPPPSRSTAAGGGEGGAWGGGGPRASYAVSPE